MYRILLIVMLLSMVVLPLGAQDEPPLPQRCTNLGNTLEAPVEGEWGFIIAESDMQAIAAAGFRPLGQALVQLRMVWQR